MAAARASGSACKADPSFAASSSFLPIRYLSELAQLTDDKQSLIYEGPFAGAVRRVKKLSLFSCGCALAAGPIILGLDAQNTLQVRWG